MPNRLANETSPYLLQHKDNPVDWYPWGEEAFAKARAEDKPIFLSIGYAACHWCHVMERESFEDPTVAAFMNEHFVNIKVDREERPDVDAIYMEAVQALTGSGGWPMSVFLTPDGKPFYAGTYFPPEPRYGMPSFMQVLQSIAHAWQHQREDLIAQGDKLVAFIHNNTRIASTPRTLSPALLATAVRKMARYYDPEWGGFGRAPKFPQPTNLELLLRAWRRTRSEDAMRMLITTLDRMAFGGIYDQLGGGFHRYSVDRYWLVPHFEKMLYDNAQLASVYLHAWQAFHAPRYQRIVEETLTYLVRDMRDPSGGFYSSQDADSEGEEGKFYVWTVDEVRRLLGEEDARIAVAFYAMREGGNWEGRNVLWVPRNPREIAAELGLAPEDLEARMAEIRRRLFEARQHRVPPATDDKVLTDWNALTVRAFAEAGAVFGRSEWVRIATETADFLLSALRRDDGRLWHTWSPRTQEARVAGMLTDYAYLVDALITLYEATFEPRYIREARALADIMVRDFWDTEQGGFFDTAADATDLVVRPKSVIDNATPSGNSMAALALLRLATLTDDQTLRERGETTLHLVGATAAEQPLGFANWLCAVDFAVGPVAELALVGPSSDLAPFLQVIHTRYLPNKVLAARTETTPEDVETLIPLLRDRPLHAEHATAYLCRQFVCLAPAHTPDVLAQQLDTFDIT